MLARGLSRESRCWPMIARALREERQQADVEDLVTDVALELQAQVEGAHLELASHGVLERAAAIETTTKALKAASGMATKKESVRSLESM